MACIRVVVMDMPRMTREIVEELIASEAGMAVVGGPCRPGEARREVARTHANLLITGATGMHDAAIRALVAGDPSIRVLVVTEDATGARLFELGSSTVALGEATPARLLRAIGEAAQP